MAPTASASFLKSELKQNLMFSADQSEFAELFASESGGAFYRKN